MAKRCMAFPNPHYAALDTQSGLVQIMVVWLRYTVCQLITDCIQCTMYNMSIGTLTNNILNGYGRLLTYLRSPGFESILDSAGPKSSLFFDNHLCYLPWSRDWIIFEIGVKKIVSSLFFTIFARSTNMVKNKYYAMWQQKLLQTTIMMNNN